MEGNKNEKVWTFKYIQDEDSFEIRIKKVIAVKSEELHITMENEKNDIWEFSCSQQFLLELDPIFKKFLDLSDIIEIILENGESKSLRIDTIGLGDKADFYFKVKFIKTEAMVKFRFKKTNSQTDENPLLSELMTLRKQLQVLKLKKKIPVINHVGNLKKSKNFTGDLSLESDMIATFYLFIDYKIMNGTNMEETLSLEITNSEKKQNFKDNNDKIIFKTWQGVYQSGSGYHDSKNFNLIFMEKLLKGKNRITLKKNGAKSSIYTLYLIAELEKVGGI